MALLGIDGGGKSSVAAALREGLEHAGHEVVDASTDVMFERAALGEGHPWESLHHIAEEGWRLYLRQPPAQSAVFTSGLLELTAYCVIRADVVEPALERGAVVLTDSFCLKNVVRTLRQAQFMEGCLREAVDQALRGVRTALSSPVLQPDVGLLLDADPALALRWRRAQRGGLEPGADLSVAGRPGDEAFVELQSALATELREAAGHWGWHVLSVDGRPLAETVSAALSHVREHPGLRGPR
ncbi:hypothetical protein C6Y14_22840 [Streptomyces dioscori]|uniref:Thymidylate kinase n=1 Tax=Streptomyces dioscori TaxID=2109333 RepID=A0A2P8Q3Q1_9ACTN|nr:hypothetical protein C6Y14_22840 [Streptomyces dioscori]